LLLDGRGRDGKSILVRCVGELVDVTQSVGQRRALRVDGTETPWCRN